MVGADGTVHTIRNISTKATTMPDRPPPGTLAEDAQRYRDAASALFWAIADALRLPRLADWLLRRD
jgi:hypothetical protein